MSHRSILSAALVVVAALLTALGPGPGPVRAADGDDAPRFVDVAIPSGVSKAHRNRSFDNPYAHIMEGYTALGAAAAVADFDGDGWEDLFVTDSAEDGKNRLYRNLFGERSELLFEEVGEAAGVADGNDAENASADALWFDYDGDGRPDLLVVRFGRSLLYRNQGPGEDGRVTFRDVTEEAGLGAYGNPIAAIAFDPDRDGDLDLLLANYFQPVNLFDPGTTRFFPESFETAANGGGLSYYRNRGTDEGGPRFEDATAEAGLAGHTGWSMDVGHADIDHDGDDDLLVASDFGTDRLYVNRLERGPDAEGPLFEDVTERVLGIDTKKGMNAEWGDFDNDGRFDAYVTNITDEYMREGNFLWQNLTEGGEIVLADVARETGTHDTGWGWAGKFFDSDNDGLLDLYVVNGWVSAGEENYVVDVFELIIRSSEDDSLDLADVRNWPPMGNKTLSGYQRNRLFHNRGGALFRDVAEAEGVDSILDARGIAVADFDRDGRLDLYVANARALPHLYRNVSPGPGEGPDEGGGHWLELELEGKGANREAIGARVWATAGGVRRIRFVDGGNGFAGQSSRRIHFGLGSAERVDELEIAWPSGTRQTFENVAADRHWRAVEGEKELVADAPPIRSREDEP
jgi:hypothetical protein